MVNKLLSKNAMSIISMDSRRFDLDVLMYVIHMSALHHERLFVILADDLYTYNRPVLGEDPMAGLTLKNDRCRYIANSIRRSGEVDVKIVVRSWRGLCTPRFFDVLRRVYLLILSKDRLLASISDRTDMFASKLLKSHREYSTGEIIARCRAYIIEETAMALYLASKFRIGDEYYPGDDAPVLRDVYEVVDSGNFYGQLMLKPHEKRFWNIEQTTSGFLRHLEWSNLSGNLM
jgi:hypothetical protein